MTPFAADLSILLEYKPECAYIGSVGDCAAEHSPPTLGFGVNPSTFIVLLFLTLFALGPSQTWAQVYGTDSHNVTVQVSPITFIVLNGAGVNLNISAANAIAGQDMMSVSDQSTLLMWGTNSSARKITAVSSLVAPRFSLNVVAMNLVHGTAAPEITLSAIPKDLVLNIGRTLGNCILQYTGIAYASQGTGMDVHVVTFTVQSQ